MARLVPNPLGEVSQPLARIETAITRLGDELDEIHALPRIELQLAEVNRGIAALLDAVEAVRDELRQREQVATGGAASTDDGSPLTAGRLDTGDGPGESAPN